VEIHIPNKGDIRANQVAVVKLDRTIKLPATITIPYQYAANRRDR
jgi:hypothetical protein